MRTDVVTVAVSLLLAAAGAWGVEATAPPKPASQPAAPAESADLAVLEQRLAASPDSLAAGNAYRLAAIKAGAHDRCLAFFERLVAAHPNAANAHLNHGFAYVDKIPTAGAVTQVILANNAIAAFTRALALRPSWVTYYTRGSSYLFWPAVFGRAPLGVADLERALDLQRREALRSYHVRGFISLGDGYWKTNQIERARQVWAEGARLFPGNAALTARLSSEGDALRAIILDTFDPNKRVDTDLDELWAQR